MTTSLKINSRLYHHLKVLSVIFLVAGQCGCSVTGAMILPDHLMRDPGQQVEMAKTNDCLQANTEVKNSKAWEYDGTKFNIDRCPEIVIGQTTAKELLQLLGQPNDQQPVGTNTLLLYSYTKSRIPMELMDDHGHCYAAIPNKTPMEEQINSATAMVNSEGVVYRFAWKKGIAN